MELIMRETITESINEGRTRQEFLKESRYDVPDRIAQLWIGRGWAVAASSETSEKRETGWTSESGAPRPSRSSRPSRSEGKE